MDSAQDGRGDVANLLPSPGDGDMLKLNSERFANETTLLPSSPPSDGTEGVGVVFVCAERKP